MNFLTIKNFKNNEIILPEDYSKVFDQIAKDLNVDLQDDAFIQKELNYSTDHINKIVEKTSKSLLLEKLVASSVSATYFYSFYFIEELLEFQ